MSNTANKVIEKLSSVVSVAGAIKNIVKDSGYINEGLEKNVSRLAYTLHKRADEITEALNNNITTQAKFTTAEVDADPKLAEILERAVLQFSKSVEELFDMGIGNGAAWLVNWIKEKVG